jgi:ufm1-conjugating enzyme 1
LKEVQHADALAGDLQQVTKSSSCLKWVSQVLTSCSCLQELQALIKYIQINKSTDSDWFTITSNKEGTHWSGKCWYIHELIKYEFDFEFDIPATYPTTAPEIKIPSLDGKTAKMYRGGAICLTVHFKPLWAKNR